MLRFEVIAPAYNEAKNLHSLVERIKSVAEASDFSPEEFQFVIVDNGSLDDTAAVLQRLKETDAGKWFRVLTIDKNQGYGHGIYQGLLSTSAPVIGWTHADLQCDPQNTVNAYKLVINTDKNILVKGTRYGRQLKDRFVSFVFWILSRSILGLNISELNAQPKIFRRELLSHIQDSPNNFAFDLYVLYKAQQQGYGFVEIPVLFPARVHGLSNWAATFWGRHRTILAMIRYMFSLKKKEGRL